ncbi:MAG: malonyl-ACP O-methyltransferase BioC [bacterium]
MSSVAFDKKIVRQSFGKAAESYDSASVLQREVGERLGERLELIKLQPKRILDLGAGTGNDSERLLKRYPGASVVAMDFALPMLKQARKRGRWLKRPRAVCADFEQLPFADQSVDMVYSSLAFQWANQPEKLYAECLRVLRPGGLLMFSTLGPDTLKELRMAWSEVDDFGHVSPFIDMHNVGDMLVHARYADPVMDMEMLTMTYREVRGLMTDLKSIGAHNATVDRSHALTGAGRMRAMYRAYDRFRREDNLLPATYEVVYGHAWAPEQQTNDGETRVPVSQLVRRR